jgi:hypothetical protein
MGRSCAPPITDLLLYSYEADFIQGLLKENEKKLAQFFNYTFHYIDEWFGDFVDHTYPKEL